jgi:hypothetical protein
MAHLTLMRDTAEFYGATDVLYILLFKVGRDFFQK